MAQLIVNADDFGLSQRINEGIARAHREGIVTSASIVASGQAFDHAVQISRSLPSLDLGIHFTLVEERPVLDPREVPSLVGPEGRFHRNAGAFMKRYLTGGIDLQDVRRELAAQIRKVKEQGIRVTHFDSHQHLHMLPRLLGVVLDLAREFQVQAIRYPRETLDLGVLSQGTEFWSRALQQAILNYFCFLARRRISVRADHFVGFLYGGRLNRAHLSRLIGKMRGPGTWEIMCHPGLAQDDNRYRHWGYHWDDELATLTAPEIAEALRRQGIQLIAYGRIGNTRQEGQNHAS